MRRALMVFAAVWPGLYLVFFIVLVAEATIRNGGDPDNDLLIPFGIVVALNTATMVVMLAAAVSGGFAWEEGRSLRRGRLHALGRDSRFGARVCSGWSVTFAQPPAKTRGHDD